MQQAKSDIRLRTHRWRFGVGVATYYTLVDSSSGWTAGGSRYAKTHAGDENSVVDVVEDRRWLAST